VPVEVAPVVIDDASPYVPVAPVTAGRTNIPQMESARSTTTFTQEFIEDLSIVRFEDLVTRSAGVTVGDSGEGRDLQLKIRGFNAKILRNGFAATQFGGNADIEPYGIERVEVLKGSDSIAYGDTTPGGFVNVVSKRPLGYDHGEIGMEFGSFNALSPRFDIGGRIGGWSDDGGKVVLDDKNPYFSGKAPYGKAPLEDGSSIDYRIVGVYDHFGSYKDYAEDGNGFYIAPSVRFNFSDRTSLTVYTEIQEDKSFQDYGIPLDRFGRFVTGRDFIQNHPDDTVTRSDRLFGYDFVHELNDEWTFEQRGIYQFVNYKYSDLALPIGFDDTTRQVLRFPAVQEGNFDIYAMQFNLNGDFFIGEHRNRLFTGIDISRTAYDITTLFDPAMPLLLNIDNPVYENPRPSSTTPFPTTAVETERQGIWVQDHFNVTEQFIISGGVRYDRVDQDAGGGSAIYEEWNPQAGAVYRFTENVSVFGNYSESFEPSGSGYGAALDRFGDPLPPETAQGHEFGVKFLSPDNRVSTTLSYFDITRQNVANPDPDPAFPFASVAAGEQNSTGFEFEIIGEVLPNLSLQSSYAYIDAAYTQDNTFPAGNRLFGVPEHSASFWARYDFEGGALDGFGVGAGVRYVGERPGGDFNTVILDSYAIASLGLFYERGDWECSVFVDNVNDERAIRSGFGIESTGTGSARGNYDTVPTQVVAKITKRF